jgi:hypothetical protein
MHYLTDIIGSFITGSIVLLLLTGVNANISSNSAEMLMSGFTAYSAITTGSIIEYDFGRAGLYAPGDIFLVADSTACTFKGYVDTSETRPSYQVVTYSFGTQSQANATQNPNDRPIFRKVNNGKLELVGLVTGFKISYRTERGVVIGYDSLNVQSVRNQIRGVKIDMRVESAEPANDYYPFIDWSCRITPRNLKAQL